MPVWRKSYVAQNSAEFHFVPHEAGSTRPQFSILLCVNCSCKMSPLQHKKKTISAPARLMKINLSEGFAMVKFSLFLGFWGVFMMTMNNKNEKKEKRLRRVPRFAITFYGPVSVNLCSPACVLSPKCVNTKLEGACPLYSSSQHVLTTSPRNMST